MAPPVPGVPTFIPNNFTNVNDIMSSPGGTFQTANPVIANNIASYGPGALPGAAFQVGGGNINGAFGSGSVAISGPAVGYNISDSGPAGGSASYEIGSWEANYTNGAVAVAGTYGTYLSVGGLLPAVGSSVAVSLVTEVDSANPASPFFGGVDLPPLVLADALIAPGVYSWVALGGGGGFGGGGAILTNAITSTFAGLAVDVSGPVVVPAGDAFTVTSTLTAYADPAMIGAIGPDLSLLPDVTLPSLALVSTPEPSSVVLALIAVAVLGLAKLGRRKRNGLISAALWLIAAQGATALRDRLCVSLRLDPAAPREGAQSSPGRWPYRRRATDDETGKADHRRRI